MQIFSKHLTVETQGNSQILDISEQIADLIKSSQLSIGMAHLFVVGSTAALTTIEFEPGLVTTDLNEMFEELIPYGAEYAHNRTWGDDNAASHLRASLLGPSLNIPFEDGQLLTGKWQQIVLIDFDTRPRSRKVICQLHGSR